MSLHVRFLLSDTAKAISQASSSLLLVASSPSSDSVVEHEFFYARRSLKDAIETLFSLSNDFGLDCESASMAVADALSAIEDVNIYHPDTCAIKTIAKDIVKSNRLHAATESLMELHAHEDAS